MVSLSATVSNAEEFGGWIQTVRGDTTVVVDEHRPVPLWQHVLGGQAPLRPVRLRNKDAPAAAARELRVDPELLRHIAQSPRSGPDVGLAAAPRLWAVPVTDDPAGRGSTGRRHGRT